MPEPRIGFAGMTHLGLNSVAAAADMGFVVICFDPDAAVIAQLDDGNLPVIEPGLPEMIAANAARLKFTANAGSLASCDVVYVAPDVPTDDHGRSDLGPLSALIDTVSAAINPAAVIVILSQVPPGFTRTFSAQRDHLYYQVETLIFGRAIERARHPERLIVGCADPRAPLPAPYRRFLDAHECPILPMRFESAELAKISINCCLAASVSVANTLAELCEHTGADWSEIIPALRLDQRIGKHAYLDPGLGIAGGNLERDLATVCRFADVHGTDADVVRAWMANSRHRKDWVLNILHREVFSALDQPVIAVLGLAYKQDTHSTKNSPSLGLLANLHSFVVRVYDPVVRPRDEWHPGMHAAASVAEACTDADVIALMTPWPEFRDIEPGKIARLMRGNIVIDPFRLLDPHLCRDAGLRWLALGAPAM